MLRRWIPLLVAAMTGSVAESIWTALAAARAHMGVQLALTAGLETFGLLAGPAALLAVVLATLLAQPGVERVVSRAAPTIGGGETAAHVSTGLVLSSGALSGSAVVGANLGRRVAAVASAGVSTNLTTLITLGSLSAFVVVSAVVAPRLGDRLLRADAKLAEAPSAPPPLALASAAVVLLCGLSQLVPKPFFPTLAFTALGFVVASTPAVLAILTRTSRTRLVRTIGSVLVVSGASFFAFARIDAAARSVVLGRAPFASALVFGLRSATDRDHDGYSPILAGGDCNDRDPRIHPDARDVPGNGVDENCSGNDAATYEPRHDDSAHSLQLPTRPNFVLVQLDALRPDHLDFAGYGRRTSPNLDAFRKTATWFRRAYTPAPSTRFAMPAVFTGEDIERIPQRRGPGMEFEMLPGVPTLATVLGEHGYDRVGYTISYVLQHIKGVGQGFRIWDTPWPVDDWEQTYPVSATLTSDAALHYLARTPDDGSMPYVLFLHYRCTHDPYAADARWNYGTSTIDRYDSAISYCDDELGRVLREVDRRGDQDRTHVIVFSDHGELFGEHGFEYHGHSLYEPDVRTLLLARIAGARPSTIDAPVTLADLNPTILELAGLATSSDRSATSLLPLVSSTRANDVERPLFLFTDLPQGNVRHHARGIVAGRYKLVRDLGSGTTGLYDVVADPEEREELSRRLPSERARLAEALEGWESWVRRR